MLLLMAQTTLLDVKSQVLLPVDPTGYQPLGDQRTLPGLIAVRHSFRRRPSRTGLLRGLTTALFCSPVLSLGLGLNLA